MIQSFKYSASTLVYARNKKTATLGSFLNEVTVLKIQIRQILRKYWLVSIGFHEYTDQH